MTELREKLTATLQAAKLPAVFADAIIDPDAQHLLTLPENKSLALIGTDVASIQDLVLASPRPVTIHGASRSLVAWDRRLWRGYQDVFKDDILYKETSFRKALEDLPTVLATAHATVLFAGGGNATLLVPVDVAEGLAKELGRRFTALTGGSLGVASMPVSPHELVHGPKQLPKPAGSDLLKLHVEARPKSEGHGFGACLDNLSFHLRRSKGAARQHSYLAGPESAARCAECGMQRRQQPGTLCMTCARNRERGGIDKKEAEQARTFDELFDTDRRLAYIYIDGRNIGKKLSDLGSLKEYRELSERLHKAFTLDADALEELGIDPKKHQVILSGGDDLHFVVPASGSPDAFSLTQRLLERIEKLANPNQAVHPSPKKDATGKGADPKGKNKQEPEDRICAGAGVIITKTLSARFASQSASALCKGAKEVEEHGSVIDFEVLLGGSPLAESVRHVRDAQVRSFGGLPGAAGQDKLRMTQRPFTLARFADFLASARDIKRVPTAPLMALHGAFEKDAATAMVTVLYQAARNPELRNALRVRDLSAQPGELADLVLRRRSDRTRVWELGIGDLLEAAEVVRI